MYDSAEAASPRAQSAQNIAQLPGLVRQASPGLTPGESRYEAATLRRDPEFYERARDLDQRIRGLQGRAQKFEREAADYARDRANFATKTLPHELRKRRRPRAEKCSTPSVGLLKKRKRERISNKGFGTAAPELGEGDLASYLASHNDLRDLAFRRKAGDTNERLSWDYLQGTPLARRESKAWEDLEALLRANPQYQGKTVLTHTQAPSGRESSGYQRQREQKPQRELDIGQGIYPVLGDQREGEGFDRAMLSELEGSEGFERVGNLAVYNAPPVYDFLTTADNKWPTIAAEGEGVKRELKGAAWPWVTQTQLVDIDPREQAWNMNFRTPGERGLPWLRGDRSHPTSPTLAEPRVTRGPGVEGRMRDTGILRG